jgi:hypothetical protein
LEARTSNSLDDLRHYFERVQILRRSNPDDFDLQLFVAEVQERIIDRGRRLREEPASALLNAQPVAEPTPDAVRPTDENPDYVSNPPPGVERIDPKTWQRAVYLALFFTIILGAAFFYLVQTARHLNFGESDGTVQKPANPQTTDAGKKTATQNTTEQHPPIPNKPTLRLYTDLVPATVSIDGKDPQELKDGELQLDTLQPGRHSINVVGRNGESAFSFDVAEKSVPRVVGLPSANNAMAVLVSTQDGKARLMTNADQAEILLDGKSAGTASSDGLTLDNLGTTDHDLQVTEGKDRQRFVLTYTPAPALTAYIKSDPNAGTAVIVVGEDGADVLINDQLYRRKTDRGQVRVPNLKVGAYTVRIHKQGFFDPAPQTINVKKAEETRVEFRLQPVPEIATLQIRGAQQGTMIYLDRDLAAAISADGSATISNVKPGEHTIELRREQAITKRFQRSFQTGDVITLSGPDVMLDKIIVENKPVPQPPSNANPESSPAADNTSMQIDGEQVRKGGGFVPYHTTKVPGHYSFAAQVRKGGGFLKHGKLQWYAGYQDSKNYVLFSVDGKRAVIRDVQDGKGTERKVSLDADPEEWLQVEMSVKGNSISARVKSVGGGWNDLGPVSDSRDLTQGKVGFLIPGNDEIAIANFRFSAH